MKKLADFFVYIFLIGLTYVLLVCVIQKQGFFFHPLLDRVFGLIFLIDIGGGLIVKAVFPEKSCPWNARAVYAQTFILLTFAAVLVFTKTIWLAIFDTGIMLNLVVVLANGGRMPFKMPDHFDVGDAKESWKHVPVGPKTKLVFLADIIFLPKLGIGGYSIGDLLIFTGLFSYALSIILNLN